MSDNKHEKVNEVLQFCGCIGDDAYEKIYEILLYLHEGKDAAGANWNTFVRGVFNGSESLAYISLQFLEDKDLIEHGTACRYSWLTNKGRQLLADLKELLNVTA